MRYIENVHVPIFVLSSDSLKISWYRSSNTDKNGVVINCNKKEQNGFIYATATAGRTAGINAVQIVH